MGFLAPPPNEAELRAREANVLVDAAKKGDARAFSHLVRRYRPRIFALALHLTGSRSDADDITQDAFLRAYRNLDAFEGRSEFFTWLYRIALHRALDVKRDRKRRPTVDLEDARVEIAAKLDSGGDPRPALELREAYAHLVGAFDRLSPVLRTTVVLTTLQGLSHKEAAVVLETTEGTIAWRVHEARAQIRRTLEANGAPAPTPVARKPLAPQRAGSRRASRASWLCSILRSWVRTRAKIAPRGRDAQRRGRDPSTTPRRASCGCTRGSLQARSHGHS